MAEEKLNTQTTETEVQPTNEATTQPEVDYKAKYEELLAESKKLKDATDKACNEAATFKKALREKQTESERIEAERAEKEAARDAELEKYRTESRINGYKTKLLEAGYDLETASTMAGNLPEGVGDEFFSQQKAFLEAKKKSIETELLNKQPGLREGQSFNPDNAKSIEDAKFRGFFGL